jgi:hypothetical protein
VTASVGRTQLLEIAQAGDDLLDLLQPLQAGFPPEVHGAYCRLEEALEERDEPEAPGEEESMRHIQLTHEQHNALYTLLSAAKMEWEDANRWSPDYQQALEAFRQARPFVDLKPKILKFADELEAEAKGAPMNQAIVYDGIAVQLRKEFG